MDPLSLFCFFLLLLEIQQGIIIKRFLDLWASNPKFCCTFISI